MTKSNKRYVKALVLISLLLTFSIFFSSCSPDKTSVNKGYITDEDREIHITKLIGEGKLLVPEDYEQIAKADGAKFGTGLMRVLDENDRFRLLVDFDTTAIAVHDKVTDLYYHSVPSKTSTSLASPTIKSDSAVANRMSAPLSLEAYDITNKRYEFNFYENCLEDVEAEKEKDKELKEDEEKKRETARRLQMIALPNDTFRFVYTIGNDPDKDLVPPVMKISTWDWIESQLKKAGYPKMVDGTMENPFEDLKACYKLIEPGNLDPETKERFLKNFPLIEVSPFRVVRSLNTKQKKIVKGVMQTAGFTVEMLKKEMEDAEYAGPERAVMYTIPIDLKLEKDGLSVSVDTSLVLAPTKQKLYKIYLYRGFGGFKPSSTDREYIIIPDGSGAIMPIRGAMTADVFTSKVYGLDDTFSQDIKLEKNSPILTGFLAMDRYDLGGIMAILNEGGAQAFVSARPVNGTNNPGATINFDLVYAERDYRTYAGGQGNEGGSSVSMMTDNSGTGVVLSKEETTAVFKIKYLFNEGNLTYSQYAEIYRDYLVQTGRLTELKKTATPTPFYVDFMGAIDRNDSVFGIPLEVKKSLTSYTDIKDITEKLIADGIKNINLRYSFWANHGYYNTVSKTVKLIPQMGTQTELKDTAKYLKDNNVGFYPSVEFQYIYRKKIGDGFNYQKDAARRLDMRIARINDRDIVTGWMWRFDPTYRTIISPDVLPGYAETYRESLDKIIDNKQISLGSIGKILNSNYKIKRIVNRSQAIEQQMLLLDKFDGYEMMFDTGNDYTWNTAKHIINLPIGSSEYLSTKESIPFIQMLLHGHIDYAGEAMNKNGDYSWLILKSLETGSGVQFMWMTEENNIFDNTYFMSYFSLNYKDSYDKAIDTYKKIAVVLDKVSNMEITNHNSVKAYIKNDYVGAIPFLTEEDEGYVEGTDTPAVIRDVAKNVFETTYGNSIKITVNYNSFDVELEDRTVVPALGYLEVKQ